MNVVAELSPEETLSVVEGELLDEPSLTPKEIVAELDRYIISQDDAKKAVAIALRNRWRRLRVKSDLKDEITPKNIIMIGPTGVGKTEISRRLAKLAKAPFVKVEASKFTEVGYVGRDVDSIIRDLTEVSNQLVRADEQEKVLEKAKAIAEERLLDLLLPGSKDSFDTPEQETAESNFDQVNGESSGQTESPFGFKEQNLHSVTRDSANISKTREKLREYLRLGKLDNRIVEIETSRQFHTQMQILGPQGLGEIEGQIKDMFSNMLPKHREKRRLSVGEARKVLIQEAQDSLIDHEQVSRLAVRRAEQTGIVFIDEIDKICGADRTRGPDVSREGVQRDLLPLVEGSTVSTKYGPVRTDHILFIASGAFHSSKPSDLMPEFQGRFPIRVELKSLSPEHFVRILTEPENALIKQYKALLETEGVILEFSADAIDEIARLTAEVNSSTENIGARRLHTLLEKLLEEYLFSADKYAGQRLHIDKRYVSERLSKIVGDTDLVRFIL